MKFIVSIFGIAAGIAILKYRKMIMNGTGHWSWAETYVGGTANAIVLIGLAVIFLSVLYPTGALDKYFGPDANNMSVTTSGGGILPNN